jgi:hypothetical protein
MNFLACDSMHHKTYAYKKQIGDAKTKIRQGRYEYAIMLMTYMFCKLDVQFMGNIK